MNIRKIIKTVLLTATVAMVAVFLLFYCPVALAGDTLYEPVYTGSMEPAVPVGSVVVIKPVGSETLKIGDIITFKLLEPPSITHRIVNMTSEGFITKGDANEEPDIWTVKKENVVGKVEMIMPYVGYLGAFVKTPLGFITLIIMPAGTLIVLEMVRIIVETRKNQKSNSHASRHPRTFASIL